MPPAEIKAYDAGIDAVIAIARTSANKLRARIKQQPTRLPFAIEALEGIVEAAESLKRGPATYRRRIA